MASRKPTWGRGRNNFQYNDTSAFTKDFGNIQINDKGGNNITPNNPIDDSLSESWQIALGIIKDPNPQGSRGRGRGRFNGGRGNQNFDRGYRRGGGSRGGGYGNHRFNNEGSRDNETSAKDDYDGPIILHGQEAIEYKKKWAAQQAKEMAEFNFAEANAEADKYKKEFWSKYPDVVKNVYEEHPEVTKWSAKDVERYRKEANGIIVQIPSGLEESNYALRIPNPIAKFEHAFINYPTIQKLLTEAGFEMPSPIQSQAWPLIMQGYDTIAIAQTGTGKTLAFLLPAYVHILRQQKMRNFQPGANVLVLAPTRELAQQIHQEVEKFDYAHLKSICIYGGVDRNKQIRDLQNGCNIIIATPGRLDDLIMAKHIDITTVTFVVLDEADRMLDCGFEPQIRKTMYKIRPDRQTIMTSATWPSGVQRLANSYMKNPVQIIIGSLDLAAVNTVEQQFEFVEKDPEIKLEYLKEFIDQYANNPDTKVLIFATSKATAAYVSSEIGLSGEISCVSIRGDMGQEEREYSIEAMKNGEAQFLVATDVASRGIDIPNLSHVINFDFPKDIEEYVHRVGRTGRAGNTGIALTFFTRSDSRHAPDLIKILEKGDQYIPEQLHIYAAKYTKRLENGGIRPRRGRYDY